MVEKIAGVRQPQNQGNGNEPGNNFADFTWYQDLDGDGYGNPDESIVTSSNVAPMGSHFPSPSGQLISYTHLLIQKIWLTFNI